MSTLAVYPRMMRRARKREGLRVCRAAWLLGISVREYREIETGSRSPTFETWDRIGARRGSSGVTLSTRRAGPLTVPSPHGRTR
jgi:transcriptional regulator with XRE-family HTH domain